MTTIDTRLSTGDIRKLIKKLQGVQKNLKKCENEITKQVVAKGVSLVKENYTNTQERPFNENYTVVPDVKDNKGKVISQGSSVIYMEFGTGEIGKKGQEHPKRDEYVLNDFNSGPIVSQHINSKGEHYWFYNGEYTQGIPAGLQVYKASEKLKELVPDVTRKVIDDKVWKRLSNN